MNTAPIVSKVWSFCTTLRDDGVSYGDYLEQLTYLIFLKMAGVAPFRWTVDSLAFKPLVDCSSRSLVVTGSRGQSDGGVGCTSLLYIQRSPCGPQPGYGIRGDQ